MELTGQKLITPDQLKRFHTLLTKLGLLNHKADMIGGATSGRTESSRNLTEVEAAQLIDQLAALDRTDMQNDEKSEKMRRKMMAYAHDLNWTKINKEGKKVADGKLVDDWCIAHSYLKKKLNFYTYNELPKLVSQFEKFYEYVLTKI